jgi:hypothetical protein
MKRALLIVLLACLSGFFARSQNIRLYSSPKGAEVLSKTGDTLLNPWCGGWVNPQFSSIDLNGDGWLDLFVFEPGNGDNRVLTFLNIGNGQYQYYPEYESYFPPMRYWALLVDYNHDGKPDIFTYYPQGGAITVYENVSDQGGLKFKRVTSSTDINKDYLCFEDMRKDTINVFVSSADVPAITDIDKDGDIDILSFDPTQYTVFYYQNMAKELGYSLDSIHFNFTNPTRCWGKFATSFDIVNPVTLGIGCGKSMKQNAHGASSLLAVDMDNDGDLDMLYANLFENKIVQMQNGRIVNGSVVKPVDTLISTYDAIKDITRKINISTYPVPYMADGTGDNVPDMIVAPMDATSDTPSHKTYLYRNTGTAPGNHFSLVTDNFIQETMLDDGEHAAPAFVDFNKDGLMDLVIATRANLSGGYNYDHLELFQNIGTAKKAVYKKVDDDFASMKRYKLAYLAPTFADLDGDGRPDMLLGRADGKTMYFKNMADSGGTLQMKLQAINFQGIHVGGYSTPCFAHLSSDSVFDLVMGRDSGTFIYYKNTGTPKLPVFKKISDSIGHVRTNLFYYGNYKYDNNGNIIDSSLLMQAIGRSAPVVADLDHDGKMDLVSGSFYGEMFFWFNIKDNISGKFTRTDTVFYNTLLNRKENKSLGLFTMPSATDLDGDGYPDMLIGNNMGGILYYGSQKVKLGIDNNHSTIPFSEAELSVYPNPVHQVLNILWNNISEKEAKLSVTDLMGRNLMHQPWNKYSTLQQINVSTLKPGIYFITLEDNSGRSGVRKFIVQ